MHRGFVPTEHSITVYTPPTAINMILDHPSNFNAAILKTLPIFVAADTLANLFQAFFRRTAHGSKFTELSKIQGLPHFALIRHIVFQTSNGLMQYPQVYALLNKIAEMRCWEPFCATLSIHSIAIQACLERILPMLLFMGEIDVLNRITAAQKLPGVSLWFFFKEGDGMRTNFFLQNIYDIEYNRKLKNYTTSSF